MNVLLESPGTSQIISVPSFTMHTSLSDIQRFIEYNPPLPSDDSWDIIRPVPGSSPVTFTRPPLAERSNLRKAALVQARKDSAEEKTIFEERFKLLEEKLEIGSKERRSLEDEIKALKQSQQILIQKELERFIVVVRFETFSRLLQVLNDDLMSKLGPGVKSKMKKHNMDYITSILEGVYPQAQGSPSPRTQLFELASSSAGPPIPPQFPNPTKRQKLTRNALKTMTEEHLGLAVQLYYMLHQVHDDHELLKTKRNRLQHPRPSIRTAALSLNTLDLDDDTVPFKFDSLTANALVKREAERYTGESDSNLFQLIDDPVTEELLKYL